MEVSETEIDELENRFPELADEAFRKARQTALDAGLSVLESDDGVIYELFPNGTRTFIKIIERGIPVVPGTKFLLR